MLGICGEGRGGWRQRDEKTISLVDLPLELFWQILNLTSPEDILRVSSVCKTCAVYISTDNFWRAFLVNYFPLFPFSKRFEEEFRAIFSFRHKKILRRYSQQFSHKSVNFITYYGKNIYIGRENHILQIDAANFEDDRILVECPLGVQGMAIANESLFLAIGSHIDSYDLQSKQQRNFAERNDFIISLTMHEGHLFALERQKLTLFELGNKRPKEFFICKDCIVFGPIAFYKDLFFVSYTNEEQQFGFRAFNFRTEEKLKDICVHFDDVFSGYFEIVDQYLYLKFQEGVVRRIDLENGQSREYKLSSNKVIQILRAYEREWFIQLGEDVLSICDEGGCSIFLLRKKIRKNCICIYKSHLVIGYQQFIEVWDIRSNARMLHVSLYEDQIDCVTNLTLLNNKLIVVSLSGRFEIYDLEREI